MPCGHRGKQVGISTSTLARFSRVKETEEERVARVNAYVAEVLARPKRKLPEHVTRRPNLTSPRHGGSASSPPERKSGGRHRKQAAGSSDCAVSRYIYKKIQNIDPAVAARPRLGVDVVNGETRYFISSLAGLGDSEKAYWDAFKAHFEAEAGDGAVRLVKQGSEGYIISTHLLVTQDRDETGRLTREARSAIMRVSALLRHAKSREKAKLGFNGGKSPTC